MKGEASADGGLDQWDRYSGCVRVQPTSLSSYFGDVLVSSSHLDLRSYEGERAHRPDLSFLFKKRPLHPLPLPLESHDLPSFSIALSRDVQHGVFDDCEHGGSGGGACLWGRVSRASSVERGVEELREAERADLIFRGDLVGC